MSITLDIEAGIASYVGLTLEAAAAAGAGNDAAIAAAIEVAIFEVWSGPRFASGAVCVRVHLDFLKSPLDAFSENVHTRK